MKIEEKLLPTAFVSLMLFFIVLSGFSYHKQQPQGNGAIEGYVLPKQARAHVVVIIPHPQKPDDTLHRIAVANPVTGYFKLQNIPAGSRLVVYYPKDPAAFRSKTNTVNVVQAQTVNLGTVTLDPQ